MGVDHRLALAWMAATMTMQRRNIYMKSKLFRLLLITLLTGAFCAGPVQAYAAKIRIVTTLTDLADFPRQWEVTWSRSTVWPLA